MKRKILIFLYISLERRQNRTTNKTKFKALLHKNKLGKVDNFLYKKNLINEFTNFRGI